MRIASCSSWTYGSSWRPPSCTPCTRMTGPPTPQRPPHPSRTLQAQQGQSSAQQDWSQEWHKAWQKQGQIWQDRGRIRSPIGLVVTAAWQRPCRHCSSTAELGAQVHRSHRKLQHQRTLGCQVHAAQAVVEMRLGMQRRMTKQAVPAAQAGSRVSLQGRSQVLKAQRAWGLAAGMAQVLQCWQWSDPVMRVAQGLLSC